MDVFKQYATDEVKESDGVWVSLGREDDPQAPAILVARSGNKKYTKLITQLVEKNQRALDLKNEAADELSDQLMIHVMALTILLGWRNIEFKGQPMAVTVDNGKLLLSVKDFRKLVAKHSDDIEHYRVAQEVAQGNV